MDERTKISMKTAVTIPRIEEAMTTVRESAAFSGFDRARALAQLKVPGDLFAVCGDDPGAFLVNEWNAMIQLEAAREAIRAMGPALKGVNAVGVAETFEHAAELYLAGRGLVANG
jgi:hypothetical protein